MAHPQDLEREERPRRFEDVIASHRRHLRIPEMRESLAGWSAALAVCALALVLRLWDLGRVRTLIFDETYYVKDGYTLWQRGVEMRWPEEPNPAFEAGQVDTFLEEPSYVVHPPLGKWIIGGGMELLGADSPWGWRISVALLGSLSVLLLIRIGRRLLRSTGLGVLAGLLLAVDGLHLVQSRTSILDLILMVFVLAAFGCLLIDRDRFRQRLAVAGARLVVEGAEPSALGARGGWRPWRLAAGVLLGGACAVKWSGLYFLAVFGIMTVLWDWWARRRAGERRWLGNGLFRDAIPAFVAMVGGALLTYIASWSGWFARPDAHQRQWAAEHGYAESNAMLRALRSLWEYHREAYAFHIDLDAEHPYEASPWGWLLQLRPTNYYFRSYDYGQMGCEVERCAAQITSVGNPLIWWLGTLAVGVALLAGILWRDGRAWAALSGIIGGYLPWLLYADRTIFTFYAVAFEPWLILCLVYLFGLLMGRPDGSMRHVTGVAVVGSLVVLIVLVSAFFWPVWTGQVIPYEQWEHRGWLPSWG
ncbi:MAG: phospholipid carrier-dependent glycosyltransferase [Brachybacterium sp.]|nr:phospholipid carrier-dependent glycosyltransferase [Brachybacterium sp.]